MFRKVIAKYCGNAECSAHSQQVDLALRVCGECGSELKSQTVRNSSAITLAAIVAAVVLVGGGYAGVLATERWLAATATTTIVDELAGVFDASSLDQLRDRATALVESRGRGEEAVRQIVQELKQEGERRLDEVRGSAEALYRENIAPPAEEALRTFSEETAKNHGLAVEAVARVIDEVRQRHEKARADIQQAMTYAGKGDYPRAASQLEQVVAREPRNAWALANLCTAYLHLNRRSDARAACERAIESDRENWLAHYNMASVRAAEGQNDVALQELKAALDLVERPTLKEMNRAALVSQMKTDVALGPLRRDPSFSKLVELQ